MVWSQSRDIYLPIWSFIHWWMLPQQAFFTPSRTRSCSLENHPSLWFIPCGFHTLISSLTRTHDPDLANQSIVYDWAAGIGSDWPKTAKPELISKICQKNRERGLFPFLWAGSYEDKSLEHQEPSPFLGKNLLEKETRGHRGNAEMRAEETEREKDPMYRCHHTAPGSSCSWSPFSHEPAVTGFLPLAPHVTFPGYACSSLRDCLP